MPNERASHGPGSEPLRVTGGRLSGRRLTTPKGDAVRPSTDRVRESLFARLGDLSGARVLDLYAGSGALGIEALSRGAASAVFVEQATASLRCIRANLEALDLEACSRSQRAEAVAAVRRLGRTGERFDLVLLDPPYGPDEARRALGAIAEARILAAGAVVVAEASRRHPPGEVAGLRSLDERTHGESLVVRYTMDGPDPDPIEGGPTGP